MASGFTGIESLLSALRVQSLAQRIVNSNISNAATKGYSRQVALLSPAAGTSLPGVKQNSVANPAILAGGVSLYAVERVRDEFLDGEIRNERGDRGQQEAMLNAYKAIQVIYPEIGSTPAPGLMDSVNTFFSDWSNFAVTPRATVVADAQNMAALFNSASRTLSSLQKTTDARVRDAMTRINGLLSQVATANEGIVKAGQVGAAANSLADSRDLALADLAELVNIDTVRLADGTTMVMTGNSRTLVRGGAAASLSATYDPHDPAFANVGLRDIYTGAITDISAEITSGKLDGFLTARDTVIAGELLKIDRLAFSMIQQVNLLHRAGYGADPGNTTNLDLFTGTEARDISVNSAIAADPLLLAGDRVSGTGDGEQAKLIGQLAQMIMNMRVESSAAVGAINPANPIGAEPFLTPVIPAAGVVSMVVNGVTLTWDSGTDSINDIVGDINDPALGLGVMASYDAVRQTFSLLGSGPITVYDAAGNNLTAALNLQLRVTSLAPINNGTGPADRPVNPLSLLGTSQQTYRIPARPGGDVLVNGVPITWNDGQDLNTVLANFNLPANLPSVALNIGFDPATQTVSITGQQVLPATAANPIGPVAWVDSRGELGQVFSLEGQPAFQAYGDGVLAEIQARLDNAQMTSDAASAAVDQLELQQDAISKVDLNEEKAKLMDYLRAYEAAVRALGVMDEMLNVLINKMAVSSSGTSSDSVI